LPGESFVGYQVMAQQMRPDEAVFAIGYGESWTGYIPTAVAFEDRFNHDWRWVGPGSEEILKHALEEVLVPTSASQDWSGQWQQIQLSAETRDRCESILDAVIS